MPREDVCVRLPLPCLRITNAPLDEVEKIHIQYGNTNS
jgi:hypothetical protein